MHSFIFLKDCCCDEDALQGNKCGVGKLVRSFVVALQERKNGGLDQGQDNRDGKKNGDLRSTLEVESLNFMLDQMQILRKRGE